mmetsp:Transcript_34164/g.76926  ORF Transcript_34164/g.76926 Transcript_34164/m.76926 type:complete len:134 (-) Transcript_34164:2650-3051(-)
MVTGGEGAGETVRRLRTADPRCSAIVCHGGVVYLTGQTSDEGCDIQSQTKRVLAKIEALLEEAGSDKSRLLTAMIWLKDIQRDFHGMNSVWNDWVDRGNKPTRACVEGRLARDKLLVEIQVTAVLPHSSRSRL